MASGKRPDLAVVVGIAGEAGVACGDGLWIRRLPENLGPDFIVQRHASVWDTPERDSMGAFRGEFVASVVSIRSAPCGRRAGAP